MSAMTDEWYVEQAQKYRHCSEGELEVDDTARVSGCGDGGAYVEAWIWVDDPSEEYEDEI